MSTEETEAGPADTRRGGRRGMWLSLLVLAAALAGGAAYLVWPKLSAAPSGQVAQGPTLYYTLDPNLIVNFAGGGRVRYLQLGIELMTRDPDAIKALQLHSPVVRNNLIMLLSDQSYDKLLTHDGKEALRQAALATVQSVMQKHYGKPAVEALYFTSFVMQ